MEVSSKIMSDVTVHMKYSKFVPEQNRRETWNEIVTRNALMHIKKFPHLSDEISNAYQLVYERKILPSMRSMQFAGKPIELNPARIYNCSYLPITDTICFSELMFLLLSGCGVGYSVQKHHIKNLPEVRKPFRSRRYLIGDSIEGWADAVKVLFRAYFEGKPLPIFDYSDIRPKGAMLLTAGGKAPGPEPLKDCLNHIKDILDRKENGDKLTNLEIHDLCCIIADAVLAGGIRRSAMISLFDLDDSDMLNCKGNLSVRFEDDFVVNDGIATGSVIYRGERVQVNLPLADFQNHNGTIAWYYVAPWRARSNNSAVILRHKIDEETFLAFWEIVKASGSGEPGFFMSNDKDMGLNPCAEISLKPFQFCNLVTINVSDVVDQKDLESRVKAATFIATLQASYTDFHYLRDIWKQTTEKEALIGVSMTGIASGTVLKLDVEAAAKLVKSENSRVAKLIGINPAARCTTVKPEGTSSLVLGSSSGIHAWHSPYFMRRIRVGKNEAIHQYLAANHPDLLEDEHFRPQQQSVIKIPVRAPEGAITREESALDLLARVGEVWRRWVKPGHRKGSNVNNVSTTVTVKPEEWDKVGKWMWENRQTYTALSVLPYDNGSYIQAPYTDITQEEYEQAFAHLREVDLTQVVEEVDTTTLSAELSCSGGACEITSLGG